MALGAEIRAEAAAQKIPLSRLAETTGVGRVSLYRYLDGTREMPVSVLLRSADTLHVSVGVLIDKAEQRLAGQQ